MRIAWFRNTTPDTTDALDAAALLIDQLRSSHDVDVITESGAHDFVWQHLQRSWDLCVYELDNSPAHEFIQAYLVNYPGVVMLRSTDVAHLRVLLLASRSVVTSNAANAELLHVAYPQVHVRVAPVAIGSSREVAHENEGPARVAVFDCRPWDAEVVTRAIRRARDAGAAFELLESDARTIAACDIVIAPGWPPFHHTPTALLAGMAAGKAVVTTEMEATAEWPAMDPQTWRPRGVAVGDPPIAVTIDPRDEEHSLMLAIRRLSSDAALREELGRSAQQWWKTHATPAHAAAAWEQILEEAAKLSPPPRPDDWPQQFAEDGTGLAREILKEFGRSPTDTLARS